MQFIHQSTHNYSQFLIPFARVGVASNASQDPKVGERLFDYLEEELKKHNWSAKHTLTLTLWFDVVFLRSIVLKSYANMIYSDNTVIETDYA